MSTASRRTLLAIVAAAVVAAAVAVAGCGSSYGGSASTAAPASPGAGASVGVASTKLGKVLVDAHGRTLYLFEADKSGMSNCAGACASVWPPLATTGKPKAAAGVDAAKLGTTKRADGSSEVTYNGHPLYTYAGDTARGQTTGQGLDDFGAEWYALSAAGNKIDNG